MKYFSTQRPDGIPFHLGTVSLFALAGRTGRTGSATEGGIHEGL